MESARVTVVILICVFGRVCGTKSDMRVKPGDNITIYCDCVVPFGSHILWIRNCSHEHQPPLLIDLSNMLQWNFPRYEAVFNRSSDSYDLRIRNVSVSDEGLYYCALDERNVNSKQGYRYGNMATHLSVFVSHSERLNITSALPLVSDCVSFWTLLFGVCPVCVLLFSICVYCLCQRKSTVSTETQTETGHYESEGEVCYASLNQPLMPKKKKLKSSDFSIYTEVRTKRNYRSDH